MWGGKRGRKFPLRVTPMQVFSPEVGVLLLLLVTPHVFFVQKQKEIEKKYVRGVVAKVSNWVLIAAPHGCLG